MPKHAPSYKHLISTSSASPEKKQEDKSVNERIASSRAHRPGGREPPPHLAGPSSLSSATVAAGDVDRPSGPQDAENGSIHPAELLRRANIARQRASRGVAGPAPPPSWTAPAIASPTVPAFVSAKSAPGSTSTGMSTRASPVTAVELEESEEIFHHPLLDSDHPRQADRTQGSQGLVEHCLLAVLRYLEDRTPISLENDLDGDPDLENSSSLGKILQGQIQLLEPHLKSQLLRISSLQPEGSHVRLSDASLRALLRSADAIDEIGWEDEGDVMPFLHHNDDPLVPFAPSHYAPAFEPEDPADEWDSPYPGMASSKIRHLPLTLHANPVHILRQLPSFSSLSISSLNLAYCRIPDIESLVTILPLGLRSLSLAGARFKLDWNAFRRAIQAMGKRMIVLRMLDLSYIPLPANLPFHLKLLLHPPATRLPSLRVLGLKGWKQDRSADDSDDSSDGSHAEASRMTRVLEEMTRKEMIKVIRGEGRTRYVEVIFDSDPE